MKKTMKKIMKQFATLGSIGYLPMPGTMGTLAALPSVYFLSFLSLWYQVGVVIVASFISIFIINQALKSFKVVDPSQIILDEYIGCLITFVGINFDFSSVIAGFLIFRLFDILKPLGIKKIETLPGAWGVLLDDCAAGLITNVLLWCFLL